MIVIHPKDHTTAMLSILYEGKDATRFNQNCSKRDLERTIHHCSKYENIMLLGHGSDMGLFFREESTCNTFNRIIVGHPHAYHLRKHGPNLIGIWCHAQLFARKEGLHGLFSGMIISDVEEAEEYGIITSQHLIDETNKIMFSKLRKLLDEGCSLCSIPELMRNLNEKHNCLENFNYNNFFYL